MLYEYHWREEESQGEHMELGGWFSQNPLIINHTQSKP